MVTDTPSPHGGIWSLAFGSGTVWTAGDRGFVSDDGGATWTAVMGGPDAIDNVLTFAFPPGDEQTIYAGSEMDGRQA